MECDRRDELLQHYAVAVRRFGMEIATLAMRRESVEFDRLYREAEVLRLESEETRIVLERHRATHGC
jgi:hypothetical protein